MLGAPLGRWAALFGTMAGFFLLMYFARGIARKRLAVRAARTGRAADAYFATMLERTWTTSLLAIAVLVAFSVVPIKPVVGRGQVDLEHIARTLALLVVFLQVGRWGTSLIDAMLSQGFRFARISESTSQTALGVVRFFAMTALWMSVAILGLSAVGVEVTPLLAGLGVGGIAVGFALQRILGDIFCSVAIVLDRPFEVGDFIQAGDVQGNVEQIGVKTTRIRSLGGEQVVIANSDLIQSRIRNYTRMTERRVLFRFGVAHGTPAATLERIPGLVRQIIEGQEKVRFDRAHLTGFGEAGLSFEVVYYVLDPDQHLAMDLQQQIQLELLAALEALGIRFTQPRAQREVAESGAKD
jgi:small-conductance mechanosensitive channel